MRALEEGFHPVMRRLFSNQEIKHKNHTPCGGQVRVSKHCEEPSEEEFSWPVSKGRLLCL